MTIGGLYQRMRARGVNIRVAKQRIGARDATPEECALLGESEGQPVLTMERATYDDTGRTVEWARHAYRASRYTFEITLVAAARVTRGRTQIGGPNPFPQPTNSSRTKI